MDEPPLAGVTHPMDVKAIRPYEVEPCKRRVELLTQSVRHTGAVALDESILSGPPIAGDIDSIVEFRWANFGQETRLEHVTYVGLTGRDNRGFLRLRGARRLLRSDPLDPSAFRHLNDMRPFISAVITAQAFFSIISALIKPVEPWPIPSSAPAGFPAHSDHDALVLEFDGPFRLGLAGAVDPSRTISLRVVLD